MELRQLRHFLAVVEHRHFGRAAAAVGLTQQALSHSISTLEQSLQARLLERGKFGAELTSIGRIFEKRARLICSETDFASAEVMAFKGGADGHIRIGVGQNFSANMMPRALLLYAKARPAVRLSVVVGTSKQLFDMLIAGKIELAVTSPINGVDAHSELEHRRVATDYRHNPSFVVMNPAHPLLQLPRISIGDLGAYPWCMPESWLAPWEDMFGLMRSAGATAPNYVVRTDSLNFAKALLMQSDFISLLGAEAVTVEVKAGLLVAVELPSAAKPAPAFISHRRGHNLQSAAQPLIHCLERAISEIQVSKPSGTTGRRLS